MGDRPYLNARVRALSGRLLPRWEVERLLRLPDVPAVAAALREGPYGAAVAEAGGEGPAALEEGLRRDFSRTLARLLSAAKEEGASGVRRLLGYWEHRALRAILRGKAARLRAEEILSAVVPTGLHDEAALEELCRQPSLRAAVDLLSAWREPAAPSLREALGRPGEEGSAKAVETALARSFLGSHRRPGEGERDDVEYLLALSADRANLVTALVVVEEVIPPSVLRRCLLPGGVLFREEELLRIASSRSVAEALAASARSVFAPAARRLAAAEPAGRPLSVVESRLEEPLLAAARRRARPDPLGIAPVADYLFRKGREVANLRLVIRGRAAGLDDGEIAPFLVLDG